MNQPNQPQVPTGYADSFSLSFGPGDVSITFMLRGTPIMQMLLPHTTSKELNTGSARRTSGSNKPRVRRSCGWPT